MLGAGTWTTARRITIPLVLPALLAGILIAFLQAMILFGSPAILALPAGFHTMTTKIWSLFQYPPKPELAAAASLPLLVVTVMLLRAPAHDPRPQGLLRRRRQERRSAADQARLVRRAGDGLRGHRALHAGVPALLRSVQRRVLAHRDHAGDAGERHLAQRLFHLPGAVLDPARAQEHLHPRPRLGNAGNRARAGHQLFDRAAGRDRASRCSASSPPRRSRFRASCSASACS